MKTKSSYDFYLILATAVMLFIISAICIYGMFYFKLTQIHQMEIPMKVAHMNRMNDIISPFLIGLILLLGICVPKRLLPTTWLHRFCVFLFISGVVISLVFGIRSGLVFILITSLALQAVVLVMAVTDSQGLTFQRKGYWMRVGSSLIHLGIILFVLDLFFYKRQTLHSFLFWITTVAVVLGMFFCFYSERMVRLIKKVVSPLHHDKVA
jgi:hypothetical protein